MRDSSATASSSPLQGCDEGLLCHSVLLTSALLPLLVPIRRHFVGPRQNICKTLRRGSEIDMADGAKRLRRWHRRAELCLNRLVAMQQLAVGRAFVGAHWLWHDICLRL